MTSASHTWIIEPRDPLIVRDGRPFGTDAGAHAASLPFPLPSMLAGGLRNKAGLGADGTFERSDAVIAAVRAIGVRGPLLVALESTTDTIAEWFAPAPADALLLNPDEAGALDTAVRVKRLVPLTPWEGAVTDLTADGPLALIGPARWKPAKPGGSVPAYWRWSVLMDWLGDPPQEHTTDVRALGFGHLDRDLRTHVSIRSATQTAEDGLLFQTRGLVFTTPDHTRLALAVTCDAPFPHFSGGLAPLGGERRQMRWWPLAGALPDCADLPERIAAARACRVLLLTPGLFAQGFSPTRLCEPQPDVTPTLFGAAVPRAHMLTGWDLAAETPKPTRRLVPAGAVYFIHFAEKDDPEAIATWVRTRWMQCSSDDEQDARDGFGLAVFGVGPRTTIAMEVQQ